MRAEETVSELLLITSGVVSETVGLADGTVRRVATLTAGMTIGELALLTGSPRVGDARADTEVECHGLPADALAGLRQLDANLRAVLLRNLLEIVAARSPQPAAPAHAKISRRSSTEPARTSEPDRTHSDARATQSRAHLRSLRCRVRRAAGASGQPRYTSATTPLTTSQRPITAAPITAAGRPRRAIQALKRSTLSLVLSGANT
jgi:CRP-like cAMP-binding protein